MDHRPRSFRGASVPCLRRSACLVWAAAGHGRPRSAGLRHRGHRAGLRLPTGKGTGGRSGAAVGKALSRQRRLKS